jgi:hypothetical protein
VRLRDDFLSGTLGGAISDSDTAITLTGFSSFDGAVFTESDDDYLVVVIDPFGDANDPEIVHVVEASSDAATPDDSVTVVRGREGTTAVEHSADDAWVHAPTRQDLYPPVNPRTYGEIDDEFIDPTLDASWTLVEDSSPNITGTAGGGQLSIYHPGGDSSQEYHAYVRSLGSLTYPLAVEVRASITHGGNDSGNAVFVSPIFTDGNTYGAGKQLSAELSIITSADNGHVWATLREWTNFNSYTTQQASMTIENHSQSSTYVRLYWTAANSWKYEYSLDGESWISPENMTSAWSRTFTPTYVGFWMSTYGSANQAQISIDHFRVYDPS